MPGKKNAHPSVLSRGLEKICLCLPNCGRALDLAKTGAERPLSFGERVGLRYHGNLCPFCNCSEFKFKTALAHMREAEQERAKKAG
jgi:hypothetical protein